MRKLTLDSAEALAGKTRIDLGIGMREPVNMKTVVRQLNIMTVYRPLSENLCGLSLKSADGNDRFMLVNSNSTRGRQHFTMAHELFHLLYDDDFKPHFCGKEPSKDLTERSADMFATALLMPREGVMGCLSHEEITSDRVGIDTAIRLGQLYGVSHSTMVSRLRELKCISNARAEELKAVSINHEAYMRGYDRSLYNKGNEGLVIGDFGARARKLYDMEKISEGHYMELLNMINYGGEGEDCTRR